MKTYTIGMKNKIETRDVNFWYGDFHALKGISMDIEEKSVIAFIGPSGCGKSTFLRLLNRMNDLIPDTRLTGEIRIDGQDIYGKGVQVDELRKNVGMVFQRPNPFPKSILENVAYGLRVNGITDNAFIRQRVEETLKGAALWDEVKDKLKVSAYALSGGQQQRLCIARAMAVSPSVLLMDEPASALDPISTAKVEELIHELKKQYTIVIVTHNMQQAARISDFTAYMYLGEMVEFGVTDQIFIKAQRIRTLQTVGESKVGEGIRPELIGIINYAAMALVQLELGVVDQPDHSAEQAVKHVKAKMHQARDLMLRKNHDYGEAWRSMRVSSLVDLILMKLLRIKQIEDNAGATLVSEGIDANFLDIVNYGVFAMIRMEEGA